MPVDIPKLSDSFFKHLNQYSFQDLCYIVASALLQKSIPPSTLQTIIEDSFTFPVPLSSLAARMHVLELWHGPSLAFKDFGAQFMARVMAYFNQDNDQLLHVLVATSGDTGGAVAAGFYKVPGIHVTILYPKGKVSSLQEKQLTTFDSNVTALEVEGSFDDCQHMVKQAFSDKQLNKRLRLTSANSINIARLIPQIFYYFEAVKQLPSIDGNLVISVPSGNFGNLTAGMFAASMGLPISKFIAATNINDIVPHYLTTGLYEPKPSLDTLSNAMDVGNPSNFARIFNLSGSTWNQLKSMISGYSFTDSETISAIQELFSNFNYVMDPHGAVGYLGLKEFLISAPSFHGIVLETAHPSKFKSTIDLALTSDFPLHPILSHIAQKSSYKVSIKSSYSDLKSYLHQTFVA